MNGKSDDDAIKASRAAITTAAALPREYRHRSVLGRIVLMQNGRWQAPDPERVFLPRWLDARRGSSIRYGIRLMANSMRRFPAGFHCEGWKATYRITGLPGSSNEIEMHLQIEPELRLDTEPVPQPQCGIARHGTLPVDDLTYPIGWHVDLSRKFGRRHPAFDQLIPQNHTGMNRTFEHWRPPSVVIHDLDGGRSGLAIRPAEAYSPLPVDANGILPPPTAAQRLQSVAGQSPQRRKRRRRVQNRQTLGGLLLQPREFLDEQPSGEAFRPPVPVAENHALLTIPRMTSYVNRHDPSRRQPWRPSPAGFTQASLHRPTTTAATQAESRFAGVLIAEEQNRDGRTDAPLESLDVLERTPRLLHDLAETLSWKRLHRRQAIRPSLRPGSDPFDPRHRVLAGASTLPCGRRHRQGRTRPARHPRRECSYRKNQIPH